MRILENWMVAKLHILPRDSEQKFEIGWRSQLNLSWEGEQSDLGEVTREHVSWRLHLQGKQLLYHRVSSRHLPNPNLLRQLLTFDRKLSESCISFPAGRTRRDVSCRRRNSVFGNRQWYISVLRTESDANREKCQSCCAIIRERKLLMPTEAMIISELMLSIHHSLLKLQKTLETITDN